MPVLPTVPTAVLLLLHVPPGTVSMSGMGVPTHAKPAPSMAAGVVLTVTTAVAVALPQLLLTV